MDLKRGVIRNRWEEASLGKEAVDSSTGPRDVLVPGAQNTSVFALLNRMVC